MPDGCRELLGNAEAVAAATRAGMTLSPPMMPTTECVPICFMAPADDAGADAGN
jgi:hypothetical protein